MLKAELTSSLDALASRIVEEVAMFRPSPKESLLDKWWAKLNKRRAKVVSESVKSTLHPLDALSEVARDVRVNEARIVFGGHFKSGKTTLINHLIGRDLLPTDDLPETGVACWLRAGPKDQATWYGANGTYRSLQFSTKGIGAVTSLMTATGQRRSLGNAKDRVDITLAGSPLHPGVTWADSPGINEDAEMEKVALGTASTADILLFVLNSKQCLSEPEIDFVRGYVADHGPASVVFVLNAFLPVDTSRHWEKFCAEKLPVHHQRIARFASDMGFTERWPPLVLPISARALGSGAGDGFGAGKIRSFVDAIGRIDHARIVAARAGRLAISFDAAIEEANHKITLEQQVLERAKVAMTAYQALIARRQELQEQIRAKVETAIARIGTSGKAVASAFADSIGIGGLQRDTDYGRELTDKVNKAIRDEARCLLDTVDRLAERTDLARLSASARRDIETLLTASPVTVEIANNPVEETSRWGGAAAGAAIGAGIGLGLGSFLTVPLGAVIGALSSKSEDQAIQEKIAKDISDTKANAIAASEQCIAQVIARKEQITDRLTEIFRSANLSAPATPSDQILLQLQTFASSLHCFRDNCKQIEMACQEGLR